MLQNNKLNIIKFINIFIPSICIFVFVFFLPNIAHATPIYEVLKETDGTGGEIKKIWQYVLNTVNLFVILVLIAVAFSQILRINVNTYGVKKVLPAILLAAIAANFSFLICRLLVDVSSVITSFFILGPAKEIDKMQSNPNAIVGAFNSFSDKFDLGAAREKGLGALLWFIISQCLIVGAAILIIILAFLLFIRNWIIYFLIPLAPLAFMATVLPQTKSVFNQWWSNFIKWVFMPVVVVFWLWIGGLWFENANVGGGSILLNFAFAILCYYLALTTPFKLGGGVMSTWSGLGKKAWGKTGGIGVGAAKNSFMTRYDRQKDKLSNRFYEGRLMGKGIPNWIQGNKDRQQFYTQQEKDVKAKREKDSLRDFYGREYAKEYLRRVPGGHGARMNNASYSRMKAFMRTQIREELPTYASMIPQDIEKQFRDHHALDDDGKLKSEQQIMRDIMAGPGDGRVTPEDLVHIKAIRDKARSMLNNTRTYEATRDVMGYIDEHGVQHVGIIPDHALNSWFSGDIAGNVYEDLTNARPVSAIGPSSATQSAQAIIASTGNDPKVREAFGVAQFGSIPVTLVGLGAGGAEAIRAIRADRDRRVNDEFRDRSRGVEDTLSGVRMVMDSQAKGIRLGRTKSELSKAEEFMRSGDTQGARSIIEGISGKVVAPEGEIEQALETRIGSIRRGTDYFDQLGGRISGISDATARQEEFTRLSERMKSDSSGFLAEARREMLDQARIDSHATVAAQNVIGNVQTTNQGATPEHLSTSDEAIEHLTHAVEGLHQTFSTPPAGGTGTQTPVKIEPSGLKSIVGEAIRETGAASTTFKSSTPFSEMSESDRRRFEESLARGITKAGGIKPSGPPSSASTAKPAQSPPPATPPPTTPPPSTPQPK